MIRPPTGGTKPLRTSAITWFSPSRRSSASTALGAGRASLPRVLGVVAMLT